MTSTKGFTDTQMQLLTMRQGGIEPVDRNGRLRVALGSDPESDLVRGMYPIRERRAPRESRVLTSREFLRLYKGVAVANLEGWLLNTFVTISWSLAGLTEASSVRQAQAAFQERMTKWFQYQQRIDANYPPYAGVWVKEVGQTMGLHSHYLLHVPLRDAGFFGRWVRRTVSRATGSSQGVIRRAARGHPLYVTDVRVRGLDHEVQWRLLRYMAKGLDPDGLTSVFSASRRRMLAAEYTGLSKLSDEGVIEGQRCGRSHAISEREFQAWRQAYDTVMEAAWRSAGRKSFHYGHAFLTQGELGRHLEGLGV